MKLDMYEKARSVLSVACSFVLQTSHMPVCKQTLVLRVYIAKRSRYILGIP